MGTIHTIRLREPWQQHLDVSTGAVIRVRRFHSPTHLDPHETVWLCFREWRSPVTVKLNEELLGQIPAATEFDITQRIQRNNVLELVIPEGLHENLPGEVTLEIRTNECR